MKRPMKNTRNYKQTDTVGYPMGFSRNDYGKAGPKSTCITVIGDFVGRFNSSRSEASAVRDQVRERAYKTVADRG